MNSQPTNEQPTRQTDEKNRDRETTTVEAAVLEQVKRMVARCVPHTEVISYGSYTETATQLNQRTQLLSRESSERAG